MILISTNCVPDNVESAVPVMEEILFVKIPCIGQVIEDTGGVASTICGWRRVARGLAGRREPRSVAELHDLE